ncbi:MAG: demethoxyubiquinone hydroxylase family protein [Gammaproteobacteria bacterium]|nr:demethoxyubiquinone hydroxylase family protein [Gammaproteobacteria bacterium]
MRNLSFIDQFFVEVDEAVRTLTVNKTVGRSRPDKKYSDDHMTLQTKALSGKLIRVNHCGEVCAQALYRGQRFISKDKRIKDFMEEAASEETEHLAWCESRLKELNTKTSILNPVFYAASFASGILAGIAGDKFSLGFVAETEKQVVKHLDKHLSLLPEEDIKSRVILEEMKKQEEGHKESAVANGGKKLPKEIRRIMSTLSKVMTKTTYWI